MQEEEKIKDKWTYGNRGWSYVSVQDSALWSCVGLDGSRFNVVGSVRGKRRQNS